MSNSIHNSKPNILWICTDQQRYDTLGCNGNKMVNTPNIDRLAQEGINFSKAYSQSPVCAPSRASFLTGRYPRTCRVRQNGQNIPEDEIPVTRLLNEAGYYCGLSGKLHISACNTSLKIDTEPRINDGYSYFQWSHHPCSLKNGWAGNEYSLWLKRNNIEYRTPVREDCKYVHTGMPEEYHQTKWCVDKAIEFMDIAQETNKPWMFSLNIFDPHHNFDPPSEYIEPYIKKLDEIPLPEYKQGEWEQTIFSKKDNAGAYDTKGHYAFKDMNPNDHKIIKAAYWAMIDLIDKQLGRLFRHLESIGQRENTVIIFTSDHGEMLGDHGIYLKGPYFYECGVHVPLIISWPELINKGRKYEHPVELMDLPETLLEAVGLPVYAGMQGKSLMNILKGSDEKHKDIVYSEFYNSNVNHTDPKAYGTMVCDGRYKLIKMHNYDEELSCPGMLYDLEKDPHELNNQYDNKDYNDVKMYLLECMCDKMAMTCDPLPERLSPW